MRLLAAACLFAALSAGGAYAAEPITLPTAEVSPSDGNWFAGVQSDLNADGDALVAWIGRGASDTYYDEGPVFARFLPGSGDFAPIEQISPTDGVPVGGAVVALNDSGSAVVAWVRFGEHGREVFMRRRSPVGVFGPVEDLGEPGFPKEVGIDADGNVTLLVLNPTGEESERVVTATLVRRLQGGGGSREVIGSNYNGAEFGQLVVAPGGRALVLGQSSDGEIQGRSWSAEGSLSPVVAISPPNLTPGSCGADYASPAFAIDPDGDAYVVWALHGCADDSILGRSWRADGSLDSTETIAGGIYRNTRVNDLSPDVAMNAAGAAYVTWLHQVDASSSRAVRGRFRAPSGVFRTSDEFSPRGFNPQAALDDRGRASVAWIDFKQPLNGVLSAQMLTPGGAKGPEVQIQTGSWTFGHAPFSIATGAAGDPLLLASHWGGQDYDHFWIEGVRIQSWADVPSAQVPTGTRPPAGGYQGLPPQQAAPPRAWAKLSHRRLVAASSQAQRRLQRSTSLTIRISTGGRITIDAQRRQCRRGTCMWKNVCHTARRSSPGTHRLSLHAALRGRTLLAGRYRLRVRLRTSGPLTSAPADATFVVARG